MNGLNKFLVRWSCVCQWDVGMINIVEFHPFLQIPMEVGFFSLHFLYTIAYAQKKLWYLGSVLHTTHRNTIFFDFLVHRRQYKIRVNTFVKIHFFELLVPVPISDFALKCFVYSIIQMVWFVPRAPKNKVITNPFVWIEFWTVRLFMQSKWSIGTAQ